MAEISDLLIAWTTVDSEATAQRMAREMVNAGLAACVQIDSGVQSVYQWKGELCCDQEWRLMVKFLRAKAGALELFINQQHPYETPEWVVVPAQNVASKYLAWVHDGS